VTYIPLFPPHSKPNTSMTAIRSLQNPRVKNAVCLRDRRRRSKQGRILIDGARELSRAIGAGVELIEIFVCEPLCESPDGDRPWADIHDCGAEVIRVTEPVFAKLAFGDRAERGDHSVDRLGRPIAA